MLLSIVIPAYNEADCIDHIYTKVVDAVGSASFAWELIFVNDGSQDDTLSKMRALCGRDERVRCVSFARNFGHQSALLAGIKHARGDAIVMMDADGQHPPEYILPMIEAWQQGFDIVQTVRETGKHNGFFKNLTSKLFYKFFAYLSETKVTPNAADFRLISKRVAAEIANFSERELFLRGLVSWLGYNTTYLSFKEGQRQHGDTKYTFRKMLRLAINAVLSFSVRPIRLSIFFGMLAFGFSFLYLIYVLYMKFIAQLALPGWSSIIVLIVFLHGIQFFLIGIIGEYIGRIYFESKRRPQFVVSEVINPADS